MPTTVADAETKQGDEVVTPAPGSSPETKTEPTETVVAPSAGTEKTDTRVPFNQDPAIMDFIDRQVSKGVQEGLRAAGVLKDPNNREDAFERYEQEMVAEGVDAKIAKRIVRIFNDMADKKVKSSVQPFEDNVKVIGAERRIQAFATTVPDFAAVIPKMREIYRNLPEETRNFIDNSPEGIDFLYSKAKRMMPATSTTTQTTTTQKPASSSSSSSSSRSVPKTDAGGIDWALKAQECLDKGDKEGYRNAVLALQTERKR